MHSARKSTVVAALMAVLVLSTGCGSETDGVAQSPSGAGSSTRSVEPSTSGDAGKIVEVKPYLDKKGFVLVSSMRTNYAYTLFPFPTRTGQPLCGFVISSAEAEWGVSGTTSASQRRINRTDSKVVVRMIRYASGFQDGAGQRREKIELRLDEVTPQKISESFDVTECGDTTIATR